MANQLSTSVDSAGTTTYSYDAAGNLLTASGPTGITTNTWDDENRRTLVVQPDGVRNTFTYDGDGLRFQKQDSEGTTKFVWDGQNYLSELDGSNATKTVFTNTPDVFGELLSVKLSSSSVTRHFEFDGLGSTAAVTTTGPFNNVAKYLYRAFGETNQIVGSVQFPFRWVGRYGYYYDPDLLEYYLRARDYDPALARFLAQDPLGFDGGDYNLYRYLANNPVNGIDPSGLYGGIRSGFTCICADGTRGSVTTWCFTFFNPEILLAILHVEQSVVCQACCKSKDRCGAPNLSWCLRWGLNNAGIVGCVSL